MLAYSKDTRKQKGFTLVELMVTMVVMTALLSVILLSQSSYTKTSVLNNAADTISLLLREAQVYGVGVKEFTPGSTEFNVSYGLSFDTNAGSNTSYIFFADRGELDQRYNSGWACPVGGTSECISKTTLTRGIYVSNVCYVRNNNSQVCTTPGGVRGVDITFARPQTDAVMRFFNSSGSNIATNNLKAARITVTYPGGSTRDVWVYVNGQIGVQ